MRLIEPSESDLLPPVEQGEVEEWLLADGVPASEAGRLSGAICALVAAMHVEQGAPADEEFRARSIARVVATEFRKYTADPELARLTAAAAAIDLAANNGWARWCAASRIWTREASNLRIPRGEGLTALGVTRSLRILLRSAWKIGSSEARMPVRPEKVALVSTEYWRRGSAEARTSETIEFWVERIGLRAFASLVPMIQAEPDSSLGLLAWGAAARFESFVRLDRDGWKPAFVPVALSILESLFGRLPGNEDDLPFLGALWRLSWQVLEQKPGSLDATKVQAALELARRHLGKLRPLLRRASEAGSAEEFARQDWPLRQGFWFVATADALWPAVRAGLLALRAAAVPTVAPDLRYWPETHHDAPPDPWSAIPNVLTGLIHRKAHVAELSDPRLVQFRQDMAEFCLDRLKTKKGEKAPVEDHPVWRAAYIRAALALRVNPNGRGHHVLNFVATSDSDSDVRELATKGYEEMRRGGDLPEDASPRRAIITAFWWLRQAHLSALGSEVDPRGAQRTLAKEARRTREEEERGG